MENHVIKTIPKSIINEVNLDTSILKVLRDNTKVTTAKKDGSFDKEETFIIIIKDIHNRMELANVKQLTHIKVFMVIP
jgi:hypothetical protein